MDTVRRKPGFGVLHLREMIGTIKEEFCVTNSSFISSSHVLKLTAALVMTLLLSSLVNIRTASAQVTFEFKFGTFGSGDGQFHNPSGVAVDSTGNIYVADTLNNRIQVFDSSGSFLLKFGTFGSGDGQFYYPYGVAVSSTGNIHVADTLNNRIQVFDSSGNFLFKFGTRGIGDYQFRSPYGIAVDGTGNIYIADTFNGRLMVYDSSGNVKFGTYGEDGHHFANPQGVAVDGIGNIYVADTSNGRIQVFDSNGNFLFKFGSGGNGDGQFQYPFGVAVDSTGNIHVADATNNRIQVFDSSGNFLFKFGTAGSGDGQFAGSYGIAVGGTGKIYVTDVGNNRIQLFSEYAGAPEPYNFIGFYPPVDNPPAVNIARAGSAVPVKFSIDGYEGMDILMEVQEIGCDSLDPLGTVEEAVSAGSRGLIHDEGTDQYTYVWKTKKAWAGSCRQLIVKLNDGTEHIAYFEFRQGHRGSIRGSGDTQY